MHTYFGSQAESMSMSTIRVLLPLLAGFRFLCFAVDRFGHVYISQLLYRLFQFWFSPKGYVGRA